MIKLTEEEKRKKLEEFKDQLELYKIEAINYDFTEEQSKLLAQIMYKINL